MLLVRHAEKAADLVKELNVKVECLKHNGDDHAVPTVEHPNSDNEAHDDQAVPTVDHPDDHAVPTVECPDHDDHAVELPSSDDNKDHDDHAVEHPDHDDHADHDPVSKVEHPNDNEDIVLFHALIKKMPGEILYFSLYLYNV